jgi:hypothetical protein
MIACSTAKLTIPSRRGGRMRWNVGQFFHNAELVWNRYKCENSWFHTWGNSGDAIFNAWKLYKAANQNVLGSLLLGDAKIRTSGNLLMNFGLASGSGVSDESELKVIRELQQKRKELSGPRFGAAVDIVGPGSILNDRNWTPLLNDAYILGGVHAGQDFHWTEEGFDLDTGLDHQEFVNRLQKFGAAMPQYATALDRDPAYMREKWKLYIVKHSNFWSADGSPRIFAREVIGLSTFGYKPDFTLYNVGFRCGAPRSDATFSAYLNGLAAINFGRNDRATINASLGEFLFKDQNAVTTLGSMTKPPGQHLLKPSATKPRDWPG